MIGALAIVIGVLLIVGGITGRYRDVLNAIVTDRGNKR